MRGPGAPSSAPPNCNALAWSSLTFSGEPAAIALIDACVRLLPGVIGQAASLSEESFAAGLLEYPHYTRPADWQGRFVPEVLVSGHHEKVRAWRRAQAEKITQERRPDLWSRHSAQI